MRDVTALIHQYENLFAVPSVHFEPLFAQAVRRATRDHAPSVVALESSDATRSEWDWAAECWPLPMVSQTGCWFLPFVPGDSMLEAFRAARETGTPVAFVDVWLEAALPAPPEGSTRPAFVGVDLAPLLGRDFTRTPNCTAGVTARDLAREANMAHRLHDLMQRHARVLWVGGAAHWERIVERVRRLDFAAPPRREATVHPFVRMRLGGTAMAKMIGRLPWHVREFAEDSVGFDEDDATRALALRATDPWRTDGFEDKSVVLWPESQAPTDVARMLLYARNLALAGGVRQRPTFHEFLTSATSVIGPAYAGILYFTA